MKLDTQFDIGDQVKVDRSVDILAVVLAICIRGTGKNVTYEIAWFHNGSAYSAWIDEWRLEPWEE